MSTREEWAWAAGIFEGEGCLHVKHNRRGTIWPHEHPYDEFNTAYHQNGKRYCIECSRIRSREYQRNKRAESCLLT